MSIELLTELLPILTKNYLTSSFLVCFESAKRWMTEHILINTTCEGIMYGPNNCKIIEVNPWQCVHWSRCLHC